MIRKTAGILAALWALSLWAGPAPRSGLEFKIPPTKIPLKVKDQKILIIASGQVAMVANNRNTTTFKLKLNADLSDLQRNATALLSSQLDKDDPCREKIQIQQATLMPAAPASEALVQLYYERRACLKVFGKRESRKLVSGNASIQLTLTPAVAENNTELNLVPQVGPIQADGSLGQLLRSGTLGDALREKIRSAILSALQKGADLSATIPPVAQPYAKIQSAQFVDAGSGRLIVGLEGEIRITTQQVEELTREFNERTHGIAGGSK